VKVGREFAAVGTEVPATWFGILNSLFIVCFAHLFSKWWESQYNLSGPMKFGLGMTLLGLGFGFLAYGSMGINPESVVRKYVLVDRCLFVSYSGRVVYFSCRFILCK
jgi:POT family proton-dependent oligopeptide transporter